MNSLVAQSRLLGKRPVVVNNLNIAKPAGGEPTLLSVDEVVTLFHEFGHALHGLLSDVRYPRSPAPAVPRDFVEYPSQVNEMWLRDPEILERYARHHDTGEPMPAELVGHDGRPPDVRRGLRDHGVPRCGAARPGVAPARAGRGGRRGRGLRGGGARRGRASPSRPCRRGTAPPTSTTSSPAAYSAGYYSYIWSEVLDADTVEWFAENGGLPRENGDAFRARAALARRGGRPAGGVPRLPRPRPGDRPAACSPGPGRRRSPTRERRAVSSISVNERPVSRASRLGTAITPVPAT